MADLEGAACPAPGLVLEAVGVQVGAVALGDELDAGRDAWAALVLAHLHDLDPDGLAHRQHLAHLPDLVLVGVLLAEEQVVADLLK